MIQILIVFILLTVSVFYVGHRLWMLIPSRKTSKILLAVFAVFEMGSLILIKVSGDKLPFPYPIISCIYNVMPVWFYISIYLSIIFIVLDLIRLLGVRKIRKYLFGSWRGVTYLSILMVSIMLYGYVNYFNKKKVELTINLSKRTSSAKPPIKIVVISDLNIGYGIGYKELQGWIRLINKENPDIVLIAGNLLDNSLQQIYIKNIVQEFCQIDSKYGTYAVMGDHEYFIDKFDSQLKFRQFLNESKITLLRDSVVLLNNSFYVIGRNDYLFRDRKPLFELTGSLDKSKPLILLDHLPVNFDEAVENKINLQFSGSISIGQVWPLTLFINSLFENPHGYMVKDNTHIYVTSGIGINGGKFRIGSQSEYIVVHLHP